jgi:alpha-maltose-1-phosphate synthase
MRAVRALFVNSGMLGHSSVASLIQDAVAHDPTVHATHINLASPLSLGERIMRATLCATPLGRTNLDYARWRSELHSGLLAARRIRDAGQATDVLHFHTQATAYASLALMAEVPSIVSIDITQRLASLEAPPALRFTYRPNITRDGTVFRNAAAIVSTSRWAAQSLATEYPDCAAKVRVLPYPVRLDRADAEWLDHRERRAGTGSVHFLFMGGDFPRKGGFDLLRAWRDGGFGDRHRLTIVSDWHIDARQFSAGIELVKGVRPYTRAWRDLWRAADVFVMPARAEAFGMVFQEAAAAGVPVIGPRINAVPEIVDHGVSGLLVPSGDDRALVAAMREMIASPDRRHAFGRAARARVEALGTIDRYGAALTRLLHEVAGKDAGGVSSRITVGAAMAGRRPSAIERLARALAGPLAPGPIRSAAGRMLDSVLDAATGGRGVTCLLPEGEVIRVSPRYRHASWNLDEYRSFRRSLRPGAVALDIGANLGSYALLFGQWVGSTGRVYAFEPVPEIRAALERHIALNDLTGVVVPVAAAASDATGRAPFATSGLHGISRLATAHQPAPLAVETITVDEFCAREAIRPDFIKIDVEGAELAVIRGARNTLRACGNELTVFVELHPSIWPVSDVTRESFETELASLGLEVEPPTDGIDPWLLEGVALRLRPR